MARHNRSKPHRTAERDRDAERHARRVKRHRDNRKRRSAKNA